MSRFNIHLSSRCISRTSCYSMLGVFLVGQASIPVLFAQSTDSRAFSVEPIKTSDAPEIKTPFTGNWTYRSFRSDPNLEAAPNDLLFGAGILHLSQNSLDEMCGKLGGEGWELKLTGSSSFGNPATIRFQGRGTIGGEEWVYDYTGYLVPAWPNGVNQRRAIVGTIVRTVPHSNGQATAGYVAQWIAVEQDHSSPTVSINTKALPESLSSSSSAYDKSVWQLPTSSGKTVSASDLEGQNTILVFSKGFDCLHCAEQINVFSEHADALKAAGVHVVFVVADTQASLQQVLGKRAGSHLFLADAELTVFGRYGCVADGPLHGTVVLDRQGHTRWKFIGDKPVVELSPIFAALDSISNN